MKVKEGCGYKAGPLPECAPLALAFVPKQESSEPRFDTNEALIRGTLFPGLELPFMNVVNTKILDTPLAEVSAIDFVCHELRLYLDTHPDDTETFMVLKQFLLLAKEARKRYTERYGPLTAADLVRCDRFSWTDAPWPWEYRGNK